MKKILRSQKFWRKWSHIPNFSEIDICNFSLFIDLRIIQICWKITKLFWNLWFLENIDLNLRNYFFFVFLQRKSPEGTLKKIEFYLGKNTVLDNLLLKKKASPSPYLEWRRLTLESIKVEFRIFVSFFVNSCNQNWI